MYKIGLDIGTTSVGFAVLSVDGGGEADRIIRLGTRIFDAAENTKDGSSLAAPRREARGIRRRSRRQIHRKDRIKGLLQGADIISRQELSEIYEKGGLSDIYEIRCGALDRVLTREEFARLLVHYAQRRGFKSNRKNEAKDTDGGKLLKATLENQQYMAKNAYRTVGEMLFKDDRFKDVKRNKGGDYSNTFLRSQIVDEVKSVFKAQRKLGSQIAMEDFEEKYLNILESQRSFETGPASGPYSGDQIAKMVGKCTFERTEDRGVKASYTFEYFNLLQKINSMGIKSQAGKRFLTKQEKEQLCELAHTTEKLTFARIRKELKLSDSEYFTALTYSEKSVEEIEKAKFQYLPAYHEMRKAFDKISKGYIKGLTVEKRDAIAKALTYYKTDEKIQGELEKSDLEKQELEAVKGIKNFSKVGNLSIKAMKRIPPYLEQGMVYSDACTAAGYLFTAHKDTKGRYLPRLPKDT
ncbi:MAG: type II CRISPR RNA-guided endonuclease Cas9, partial [Oscillospiraceae bacterium]